MCTAIRDAYLCGRTLDIDETHGEQVVVTPRDFPFSFRYEGEMPTHPAFIGTAHVADGVPLYYDAMSETGLAICALRFAAYAVYHPPRAGRRNLASYEVIPRLLGICRTVEDAVAFLGEVTVTPDSFTPDLPATPLHWLIADKKRAVVMESTAEGCRIYDDPVGVMTNHPPFPYHMARLADVAAITSSIPENGICPPEALSPTPGAGSVGLPGDMTSSARFLRAVYAKYHTIPCAEESPTISAVSRFFHMMDMVSLPEGCSMTVDGRATKTIYTSCMDLSACVYYFTTYGCRRLRGVAMGETMREGTHLLTFPMQREEDILLSPN